jgi:hypothetical protein
VPAKENKRCCLTLRGSYEMIIHRCISVSMSLNSIHDIIVDGRIPLEIILNLEHVSKGNKSYLIEEALGILSPCYSRKLDISELI